MPVLLPWHIDERARACVQERACERKKAFLRVRVYFMLTCLHTYPNLKRAVIDCTAPRLFNRLKVLCTTIDPKYRISRAHFTSDQFIKAKSGECTTLRTNARANVPLAVIWKKPWLDGVRVHHTSFHGDSFQTSMWAMFASVLRRTVVVKHRIALDRRQGDTCSYTTRPPLAQEKRLGCLQLYKYFI